MSKLEKWTKVTYKDGWFPGGTTCVLTNAEADGLWKGRKYAIFDLDSNPHVAFWPMKPIVLSVETLSKEEAGELLWKTTNRLTLLEDFENTYG